MHYATILQGVALSVMYQGFCAIRNLPVNNLMTSQYGGHFQYLTIQGLFLACACMILGIASNVLPGLTYIRLFKRYIMMVAMPVSVIISTIYWSLLLLFPALIIPAMGSDTPTSASTEPDPFPLPLHVDLSLHAVPAVSLIFIFFIFERKYSDKDVNIIAPFAAVAFALWYGIWVEHCGKMNHGLFPYPFLTNNTQGGRITIYIGATVLSLLSFRLLNYLHGCF